MSFSFDIMNDAILTLEGDRDIKFNLRLMVGALHSINHEQKDLLNYDDRVRKPAAKLQERMKYLYDTANDDA